MTDHVIRRWLSSESEAVGEHKLMLLAEVDGARPGCLDDLRDAARHHYVSATTQAHRLAAHGAVKTAKLLEQQLPKGKKARSGDLGEILATEVAEQHLKYRVPIRRLRWKDGREMALRGDDIVGVARGKDNRLRLLKGESKSRAKLAKSVVGMAAQALDADAGRPSRHSVLFVADRLREEGEEALATELEDAVLNSFRAIRVEHLLFTFNGNDASTLLRDHLKAYGAANRIRYAVTVRVDDHGQLIHALYEGI